MANLAAIEALAKGSKPANALATQTLLFSRPASNFELHPFPVSKKWIQFTFGLMRGVLLLEPCLTGHNARRQSAWANESRIAYARSANLPHKEDPLYNVTAYFW